jgi:tetratricopeptide (TPR) repeat protein
MPTLSARDSAYAELDGPAAGLYCQLGACPAPWIDAPGLAALADLPAADTVQLARSLVGAGLLDVVDDGFALGEDGHLHARTMAEEWGEAGHGVDLSGLDRYFAFLNDAARAAERLITPSHRPVWEPRPTDEAAGAPPFELEEAAALDWLEVRLPTYLAVMRYALLDRRYPLAVDLAHRLWPVWLRRRRPEERYEALLLGLAAAMAMQDSGATGQMLTTLAGAVRGSRPIEAYEFNRRAVELYQDSGDTLGVAQAMNGMAKSLLSAGHLRQAAAYFCDAEQLRAGLGYVRGAALSRQGRGRVALAQGDAAPAAELLADAHRALLEVGDYYDAALTLAYHAEALAALGDLDGAWTRLDTAATNLAQASSVYGQGVVWQIRARVLEQAGRGQQAQEARVSAHCLLAQVDPVAAGRADQP